MTLAARASLLALALAVVAPRAASAQVLPLDSGFQPAARALAGMSGGPYPGANVDSACRGWIPGQPQHSVITRTGFGFLRVFVQSATDTTLVVRGANGTVYCADDTYGLNPGLDLNALPPGRYDIFVGSYSNGTVGPYQLYVSENAAVTPETAVAFAGAPQAQAQTQTQMLGGPSTTGVVGPNPNTIPGPNPNPGTAGWGVRPGTNPVVEPPRGTGLRADMPPAFGRVVLHLPLQHAETRTARIANATVDASSVQGTGACRGWIAPAPSFVVNIPRPQPFLRFFLNSAADTTLLIQYPDGHLACADDSFNTLQPSIEGAFPAGNYVVWAGIYRSGMERPFRLSITADQTQHP
ncbi:MAG: hypothetical protein WCJ30_06570 [Deltaproteobacteria bacterium]